MSVEFNIFQEIEYPGEMEKEIHSCGGVLLELRNPSTMWFYSTTVLLVGWLLFFGSVTSVVGSLDWNSYSSTPTEGGGLI